MTPQIVADRIARKRLTEDATKTKYGIPPLSVQDMTWEAWEAYLHTQISLAFAAGQPSLDVLEDMLAAGVAAVMRLEAQLALDPVSGEAA